MAKVSELERIFVVRDKRLGLTQQNIADQLGITRANYISFEAGKHTLTPDQMTKLYEILEIEPEVETANLTTVSILEVLQEMTPEELEEREQVITQGMQVFIEVGEALADIRDRKGYKHQYGTFEEYCRQRWGLTARHCRNLIGASKVAAIAEQNGKSLSQTAAQHIATLEPKQQIEFMSKYEAEQMTTREVERSVREYRLQLLKAEEQVSELLQENTELKAQPITAAIPEDYQEMKTEVEALRQNFAELQETSSRMVCELKTTNDDLSQKLALQPIIRDVVTEVEKIVPPEDYDELIRENQELREANKPSEDFAQINTQNIMDIIVNTRVQLEKYIKLPLVKNADVKTKAEDLVELLWKINDVA